MGLSIGLGYDSHFYCRGTLLAEPHFPGFRYMTRLADRIRKARLRAGMSQNDLAGKLNVSRGAVANWESASGVLPATERLQRIAQATGVLFEWLAMGRGASQYQLSLADVATADVEIVEDRLELRLLRALRSAPQRQHMRIIEAIEAQVVASAIGQRR